MAELWKQCADWLCRLEVLPGNHRITWPDATIQDLAYTLRDGVLLCHIADSLDPNSVDMRVINQRPQMAQFLCLKNIRHFLHACSASFGLRETDLFQAGMLYDYTDFARVLHTLSKLSNCAKARQKGVPCFPQTAKEPSQAEEEIYRTLEDLVNEDNYEEFYYRHHGGAGGGGYGVIRRGGCGNGAVGGVSSRQYYTALEQEEDIYEDLCSFKSSSSRRLQRELNFQPKEKRDYCVKELVETEGNYVDVLNMLRKHFIRPITSMKDSDKKIVFMNIKELGETHAGFYQDLLESVTGKSRKVIGEIFLDYKERFLKYGDYCSMLPRAQELLDSLTTKDERVREEVTRCEAAANEGKFRLNDLLAVPMQRVLKYHLLLHQLASHTPDTHEESHSIQQAYEAMLDVSDYINEVKRDSEQLHIIREIQSSITDWNMPAGVELKDYGRLRKDGELKVQGHDQSASSGGGGGNKTKVRYVFVFDKVVLMCKAARGDHYSYKDSLKLGEYRVQDVPLPAGVRTMSRMMPGRESRWAHSFMLVHHQSINAYTMYARTEEDKNKWVSAIREALGNVYPAVQQHSHEVAMFTFDRPLSCDYCHKLLKGLFYQGYRCEKCGRAMHRQCIGLLIRCGRSVPPALPPRPPSMLPTAAFGSVSNRFSSASLDECLSSSFQRQSSLASIASTPTALHPPILVLDGANPNYINTKMEDHSWFVGEMGRDAANARLSEYPLGTFLVRSRVQNGEKVGYALSLKTLDDVKHMKICCEGGGNTSENRFYLSDTRKFRSVVELISHFSRHSLKESFTGLDALLRFSVGELSIVEALFDYRPDMLDPANRNQLPLVTGERVTVIDKAGDAQGWWKAYNGYKVGFIPKEFVAAVGTASREEEKRSQSVSSTKESTNDGKEATPDGSNGTDQVSKPPIESVAA